MSVTAKITATTSALLALVVVLGLSATLQQRDTARSMRLVRDLVTMSTRIGDLVHETQKERGLSTNMTFKHYKIVEFCNLNSCAEMMSADMLAGVFMPVKFIAYQGVKQKR